MPYRKIEEAGSASFSLGTGKASAKARRGMSKIQLGERGKRVKGVSAWWQCKLFQRFLLVKSE
jgi:hypothetical protein